MKIYFVKKDVSSTFIPMKIYERDRNVNEQTFSRKLNITNITECLRFEVASLTAEQLGIKKVRDMSLKSRIKYRVMSTELLLSFSPA